ncbi:MAG: alpha/beta hydrolase [Acetobacteraceae bacterium]|nr:alpha/beta hydrolase [Acetobacteraceae bacterium]
MLLTEIPLKTGGTVTGLLDHAGELFAIYIFAHGAGAGMRHPFMRAIAECLSARGVSVLRYQFPYMQAGSRRPDPPRVAHAAVRAAVAHAAAIAPGLPLFAGGKSFGGRMTSQAQAASPLPGVRGLLFLGYPLHPSGKPATERARHLETVRIPMLFLQGGRDALADLGLLKEVLDPIPHAALSVIPEADHSFHVPRSTRPSDAGVPERLCQVMASWIRDVIAAGGV